MSIKIKAICRKGQSPQNQTITIYLRLTINRKSRYVSTGVKIPTSYWDFDNQDFSIDCPQFQCKVYEQIDKLHRRIKRLEALEIALTFDNILEDKQRRTNCTLREYFDRVITKLLTSGKVGTASKYQITSSLLSQAGLANQRLEDLATNDLRDFELFLVKRGNKPNSLATKFSVLKAVYNKALTEKVFICKENPFATYKVGSHWTKTRKRAIRKEDVQKLMNAPLPDSRSPYTELARDIFLFSYFSAGINYKDIATLRYSDLVDGRIYYRRHKTGKEMNCRLMPQAQEIIEKYSREDATEDDYIFPILDRVAHKAEQQIYNRLHKMLAHINRELKEWSKRIGLRTPLTTYVARHTYATVLKRSGVNIAIISESLGHSDLSTTQIYLDSFENSQIDEAMKNLL